MNDMKLGSAMLVLALVTEDSCKPHAHTHAPLACIVDSGTHREGGEVVAPHIQRLNGWRGRTRQNRTTNNFANTKVFLVSSGG